MTNDDAIMQFIKLARIHTNESTMKTDVENRIKASYDDILFSVIASYKKEIIPRLIICRTFNKYSVIMPVKTASDICDYYLLYDEHLNDINRLFNAFFLSERNVEHDIWKFSYELFAEEALLSNEDLLVTYYGFNKVALGPFDVFSDRYTEMEFILDIQEKYILAHEVGHWVFAISKQKDANGCINISGDWSVLFKDIKDILCEIYINYQKMYHDKEYITLIEEQNDIITNNIGIVEECFADAIAYAFIFSYVSQKYLNATDKKLLAGKSLFLEMMNLQLLAMHHMTVSDETFENSTSIRLSFFRNYVGLYFEKEVGLFVKMLKDTVIRYEKRITNPMLEVFGVLEDRENYICDALINDSGEINLENLVGLFDTYHI